MSVQTTTDTDVIQSILGVGDESPVTALRAAKPDQIDELQAYYDAVFAPESESAAAFSVADRLLVAIRVASHNGSSAVVDWYTARAIDAGAGPDTISRIRDVSEPWAGETALDAAIRHADLLTTRPSAAQASDLQALKDAGHTPAAILSISQTIAFVSYQLRLIAGLRAFGGQS